MCLVFVLYVVSASECYHFSQYIRTENLVGFFRLHILRRQNDASRKKIISYVIALNARESSTIEALIL